MLTPGGRAARKQGCICPTVTDGKVKGFDPEVHLRLGFGLPDGDVYAMIAYHRDCPMHGAAAHHKEGETNGRPSDR